MIIPKSSNGHGFHGAFDVAIFGGPVEPALAEATSTFDEARKIIHVWTRKHTQMLYGAGIFTYIETPKMAQFCR